MYNFFVSAILRDGSGLKRDLQLAGLNPILVSAILRDGSGLKRNLSISLLYLLSFCHPSGWQWIETAIP